MSLESLNLALKTQNLSPTRKLVLVVLANYADEHGSCYPSYKHISKIVGLKDPKGVQRIIKEFEQSGLLRIEHRITEDRGQTSNRYHLTFNRTPLGAVTPPPRAAVPSNTKEDTKEEYSDEFRSFWKVYPRKVGKFEAHKSFKRLVKKEGVGFFERLLRLTVNFKRTCEHDRTDQQFIPHASTYLNNRRFEDFEKIRNEKVKSINRIAG